MNALTDHQTDVLADLLSRAYTDEPLDVLRREADRVGIREQLEQTPSPVTIGSARYPKQGGYGPRLQSNTLSQRDRKFLDLIAEGMQPAVIALYLGTPSNRVYDTLRAARKRFGFTGTNDEFVRHLIETGVIAERREAA